MFIVMLFASISASAYDFEIDGIYYNVVSLEDGTCEVTYGDNKYEGEIIIPGFVLYDGNRFRVVAISTNAFAQCNELSYISIPESITNIQHNAFRDCLNLEAVEYGSIEQFCTIHYEVHYISQLYDGESAPFKFANRLYVEGQEITKLKIPDSIMEIGAYQFFGCKFLSSVIIPNSVTIVGDAAFRGCSGLEEIVFEDGDDLLDIGAYCFGYNLDDDYAGMPAVLSDCKVFLGRNLSGYRPFQYTEIDGLIFGNKVTTIRDYEFRNCKKLSSIIIPPSITKVGAYVFKGCSGLKKCAYPDAIYCPFTYGRTIKYPASVSFVEDGWVYGVNKYAIYFAPLDYEGEYMMPNVVTTIGDYAFGGCSGLTAVKMSGKLKNVGHEAFKGCGLNEITIPPSVLSIGSSAFADNQDLKDIKLSYGLNVIADQTFSRCKSVENVYITASTPPLANDNVFSGYNAELWTNNKEVSELYASAPNCWYWFGERKKQLVLCDKMNCKEQEIRGKEGTTLQLNIELSPENVTLKDIFWESTNNSVATVDVNGQVTFVKAKDEDCKIIAMSMYENIPNIEIPVTTLSEDYIEVESISIDCEDISLAKGETAILKVSVLPANASDKSVVWSSSNESVAEVNKNGTVVAISEGEAIVSATAEGGLTAKCKVRVLADSSIDENISYTAEIGRYDLTGKAVSEDYRGIVIVRYSDGSTSKMVQR